MSNLNPPTSVVILVKDNPQADSHWKNWLENLYSYLISTLKLSREETSSSITINKTLTLIDTSGGAVTATLPPAAGQENRIFVIKDTDGGVNQVTIDGDGAETIDGSLTLVLAAARGYATLISDGANWHRIG